MSIPLKNRRAIDYLRAAGRIVAESFEVLKDHTRPGVTLRELDWLIEAHIRGQGASSLFKGYRGNPPKHPPFPGVICASLNEEICHGLPDERVLRNGDVASICIAIKYQDFCSNATVTFAVGSVSAEAQRLLEITRTCLRLGIEAAQPLNFLYDIGTAIQNYTDTQGVSVVREWGGHGVGKSLHEPPSVSHVREAQRGPRLRPGMVFTIEPMINAGQADWRLLDNGWTVVTVDGSLSAQFEHTIVITEHGPEILTQL